MAAASVNTSMAGGQMVSVIIMPTILIARSQDNTLPATKLVEYGMSEQKNNSVMLVHNTGWSTSLTPLHSMCRCTHIDPSQKNENA